MTILNSTRTIREAGNGSKTAFDFPFRIYAATDLLAYKIVNSTGVRTLGVLNVDYTVSFIESVEGGTLTWIVAPTSLEDSFIEGSVPYTQPTNIPTVGSIRERQLENAFDRLCVLINQLLKKVQLSPKFISSSELSDVIIDDLESLQYLRVNAAGDGIEMAEPTATELDYGASMTFGTDASKASSPSAGDVHFALDTNIIYRCLTAGVWTASINRGAAQTIASATTCDIGASLSENVVISGTTTITGLGTVSAGTIRKVRFSGILTLTHNATSLILPGGANITTAAGDCAEFISEGSGNWRCFKYQKASGLPVVSISAASQAEQEAGTEAAKYVAPLTMKYAPGVGKAWICFNGTGTIAIRASHNVSGITDNGGGDYTVTWDTDFSSADYAVVGAAQESGTSALYVGISSQLAGSVRVFVSNSSGANTDSNPVNLIAMGDI